MRKITYFLLIGGILLAGGLFCGAWAQERPKTLAENPHYTFEDYHVTHDVSRDSANYSMAEVKQHYNTDLTYSYDASYPTLQTSADLSPPRN